MMREAQKRIEAFTLIELLITIAIVGILASLVISNVSGGRILAQQAKTEASLRSAQAVAIYCLDMNTNLNVPNIANTICDGQGNWPAPVGFGWIYDEDGTSCGLDMDVSDGSFLYCASDGTRTITCTENGCIKS